jgi:hypothetical protein
MKHQKEFFEQLTVKWNIKEPNDWNKVTTEMVKKAGGHFIYKYYNGSWKQGKYYTISNKKYGQRYYIGDQCFFCIPRNAWDIEETLISNIISKLSQYLRYYSDFLKALQAVYPDYYLPIEKPHGYWKYKANQKRFFDQLAVQWKITKPEDWNKITVEMVLKEGGHFITAYYNASLRQGKNMIKTVI